MQPQEQDVKSKSDVVGVARYPKYDNIQEAIHHEIDKLERNGIEPGTGRRIYLEGMER